MSTPASLLSGSRLPGWLLRLAQDSVIRFLLVLLVASAVLDVSLWGQHVLFALSALWEISIYLFFAIVLAAAITASGADRLIKHAFSGSRTASIFAAAAMGALSPFCSCGVIPLVAAMLRSGVPLAPVMAFWIASPIMDPEMFIVTLAGISLEFAVAKTIAALVMGLLAGFAVMVLERGGALVDPLRGAACSSCCDVSTVQGPVQWRFWQSAQRRRVFLHDAGDNALFLGKWLTLAFLLESLMLTYTPASWINTLADTSAWLAIPLAALVGVPAYLNGYAAIPLVSGLMDLGMPAGAALSFITAGAVSSIPAAIAVYALVKRRVFALYLLLGLSGAILSGAVFQLYSAL